MQELSESARADLRHFAAQHQPSMRTRTRNWRAVEQRIVAARRTRLAAETRRIWRWRMGVATAVAVAAGVLLSVGSVIRGSSTQVSKPTLAPDLRVPDPPPRKSVVGHSPAPVQGQPLPRVQPAQVERPVPGAVLRLKRARPDLGVQPAVQPDVAVQEVDWTPAQRLAEETKLVRRARKAVASGDDRGALALYKTHKRRFPAGVMVEDRRAWIAILLCRLGHRTQGATAAASFFREHASSPHRPRVAAACADFLQEKVMESDGPPQ